MKFSHAMSIILVTIGLSSAQVWAGPTGYPAGSAQETAQIETWKAEMNAGHDKAQTKELESLEALISRIEAGEFDQTPEQLSVQNKKVDEKVIHQK